MLRRSPDAGNPWRIFARPGAVAVASLLMVAGLSGCATGRPARAVTDDDRRMADAARMAPERAVQYGLATWYGPGLGGRPTASGETFVPKGLTAAHRTLPFGTWVEVQRLDDGRSVRVRINDRGPWGHENRIIDLAEGAARRIGLVRIGLTKVVVRVLGPPPTRLTPVAARHQGLAR